MRLGPTKMHPRTKLINTVKYYSALKGYGMQGLEISVEEMWKTLESAGISRKSLERLHPSRDTITHIYLSLKNK